MKLIEKIRRHITRLACAATIVAALGACTSHRNIASDPQLPIGGVRGGDRSNPLDITAKNEAYRSWKTLYAPFSLRMESPASISLSGRATMVSGQAMLLSLRMFGFEGAVIYLDTDSAYVADKVNKYLAAMPMTTVREHTGLDLSDIQNLLLGRLVYPGRGAVSGASQIKSLFDRSDVALTPRKSTADADWQYTLTPDGGVAALTVTPRGIDPVKFTFADPVATTAGPVSTSVELSARSGKTQLAAGITWNMDRAEWNAAQSPRLPQFRGYTRISAAAVLEVLKKL